MSGVKPMTSGRPPLTYSLASQVILADVRSRVGPKGQVVIPKALRDRLGIEPGDEVDFRLADDHVAIKPAGLRRPLRGRFRRGALSDELLRQRVADRAREEA
jgi:AbrB family looped-hinge helix DNA binding protein